MLVKPFEGVDEPQAQSPPAYDDIPLQQRAGTSRNSLSARFSMRSARRSLRPSPNAAPPHDVQVVGLSEQAPVSPKPLHQQQYPPQPQMSISGAQVGGDRNIANKPYDWRGERPWTYGMCNCCGACGTCCTACWCPCMTYSSNRSRRQALERNGAPHPEGGHSCGGDCLLFCCIHSFSLMSCGWVLEVVERGNTRQRYKISGNQCGDCMASWCCLPCVLMQESREIEGEERSFVEAHAQHISAVEPHPLVGSEQQRPKV